MMLFSGKSAATLSGVSDLRGRFARAAADLSLCRDSIDEIETAIAELAVNAVRHGDPCPSQLSLDVAVEGRGIAMVFKDDGGAFPDFRRRLAGLPVEQPSALATDGRGLWLIREAMDRFDYCRDGHVNRWTLFRAYHREKPSLLIIEDDAATRAFYASILAREFRVTSAESTQMARTALENRAFDLVVADYHVGKETIGDLLAEFDARGAGLQTPVVIITSDATGAARIAAEKLGIHSVMTKPVRSTALRERVREALSAHRAQQLRLARRLLGDFTSAAATPSLVEASGFRVASRTRSAGAGGGDLFIDLGGEDRRRLVLADCRGHGVRARFDALLLAGAVYGLRASLSASLPSAFVDALSQAMRDARLTQDLIATVLVVDLLADGRIEMATGGHPAPLLVGAGGIARIPLVGGLPGIMAVTGSRSRAVQLRVGERLFAATDGIAPASAETLEGLPPAVLEAACAPDDIVAVADRVAHEATNAFGHQPADDWTFILIERADAERY